MVAAQAAELLQRAGQCGHGAQCADEDGDQGFGEHGLSEHGDTVRQRVNAIVRPGLHNRSMPRRKHHHVYVGMTGLDPDVRFDKHKAGIQANRFAQQYGLRLLPDMYEGFNPMRYKDVVDKEIEVGIDLRSAGFGVWQA